jgi:hypothetical protein
MALNSVRADHFANRQQPVTAVNHISLKFSEKREKNLIFGPFRRSLITLHDKATDNHKQTNPTCKHFTHACRSNHYATTIALANILSTKVTEIGFQKTKIHFPASKRLTSVRIQSASLTKQVCCNMLPTTNF